MAETDRHDAGSVYHKLTLDQLIILVPQIRWDVYLKVKLSSNHSFSSAKK